MHRVKVRRLGGDLLAIENGIPFTAKPLGWDRTGLVNSIRRAFTLKYQVYDRSSRMVSEVEFESLRNYILVKQETGNTALDIPMFYLNAQRYYLKEKLTGFLVWPIWDSEGDSPEVEIVIEGSKSMTEYSIEMNCSDDNFQFILKEFGIGLMIRWMSYLY